MWLELALAVIVIVLAVQWLKHKKSSDFWGKYGVPSYDISKYASSIDLLLGLKSELEVDRQLYKEMGNQKFCGIIQTGTPIFMIKDIDVFKTIFIKDFDHFVDRKIAFGESKSKMLLNMLPTLTGTKWRGTRLSVGPVFTTGKIRRIMETFNNCGKEWTAWLKVKSGLPIEIKDVTAQYAVDVIAASVFGLNAGSIQNPDSPFLKIAHMIGDSSLTAIIKMSLALRLPKILKLLNLETVDEDGLKFFENVFDEAIEARESGKTSKRNDFLQLVVDSRKGDLKALGSDELSDFEKDALLKDKSNDQYLRDNNIAQGLGFVFFIAGYHGVAMSVSYAAHALAVFQDMQERLRKEVDAVFKEDGTVDYDDVNVMPFLDMFVSEVLRFYPITSRLARICTKPYKNEKLGINIPKGTEIGISINAIHRDPKFYPDPDTFNPEHFSPENKANRNQYAYMPFGHGPRNCIGMRFGLVEVKTAIAHLVHNFSIEPTKTTSFPVKTKLVGQGMQIPGKTELILRIREH